MSGCSTESEKCENLDGPPYVGDCPTCNCPNEPQAYHCPKPPKCPDCPKCESCVDVNDYVKKDDLYNMCLAINMTK